MDGWMDAILLRLEKKGNVRGACFTRETKSFDDTSSLAQQNVVCSPRVSSLITSVKWRPKSIFFFVGGGGGGGEGSEGGGYKNRGGIKETSLWSKRRATEQTKGVLTVVPLRLRALLLASFSSMSDKQAKILVVS